MASASKLGCLIMAAGNSNRFGENKLFAAYRGTSLLELAFLAVPPGLFSCVTVVSQYEKALELAAPIRFYCDFERCAGARREPDNFSWDAGHAGLPTQFYIWWPTSRFCSRTPSARWQSAGRASPAVSSEPPTTQSAATPASFRKNFSRSFSRSRATPAAAASSGSTKSFFASLKFHPKSSMTATPSARSTP